MIKSRAEGFKIEDAKDAELHQAIEASLRISSAHNGNSNLGSLPVSRASSTPNFSLLQSRDDFPAPTASSQKEEWAQKKVTSKSNNIGANNRLTTWEAALKSFGNNNGISDYRSKLKPSHGISGVIRPKGSVTGLTKSELTFAANSSKHNSVAAPPGLRLGEVSTSSGGSLKATDLFKWTLKNDEPNEVFSDASQPRQPTSSSTTDLVVDDFPALPEPSKPPTKRLQSKQVNVKKERP